MGPYARPIAPSSRTCWQRHEGRNVTNAMHWHCIMETHVQARAACSDSGNDLLLYHRYVGSISWF
eukprot:1693993-Pleurochrysis_carterae.AAC.1